MEKKEQEWIGTLNNFNEFIKAQKYTEAINLAESSTFTFLLLSIER